VTIELNRRFVECNEERPSDPDLVLRFGFTGATLGWDDLLARRRVVLLAVTGSGKTTETIAQARRQANAGRPAFYLTVEDVGRAGLERALKAADRAPFAAWRASDEEAWFFIDSVDEAKDSGVKLRGDHRA
jgi:KaiC/GvpD/RAD55 family RecA-like ATPase